MKCNALFLLTVIILFSCQSAKNSVSGSLPVIDKTSNLHVFVGKRIEVTEFSYSQEGEYQKGMLIDTQTNDTLIHETDGFYSAYYCKYLVEQNVYNDLDEDTAKFITSTHYEKLGQKKHRYLLLYVSVDSTSEIYSQHLYMYDPLIKTVTGRFVGKKGKDVLQLLEANKTILRARGIIK